MKYLHINVFIIYALCVLAISSCSDDSKNKNPIDPVIDEPVVSDCDYIADSLKHWITVSDIRHNSMGLTEICSDIAKFQFLSVIYYQDNNFSKFPEPILRCKKICLMNLSHNEIPSIPDDFCNLTNLGWLFLDDNHFKKLPENFGNLKNLDQLFLKKQRVGRFTFKFQQFS